MRRETNTTGCGNGELISADAVRGAFARRRRMPPVTPAAAAHEYSRTAVRTADDPASPAPRPMPLRRWSVAELIAGAVPRIPADRVNS